MASSTTAPSIEPVLAPAFGPALGSWLATTIGASKVEIANANRLAGGAVQENWRLEVDVADGARQGRHTWVLRTDAPARIPLSLDRATEYDVISAAHARGVKVADPIARCSKSDVIGTPFFVQSWLAGSAQARHIVRDPSLSGFGDQLASELGRELARIHAITPTATTIPSLVPPAAPGARHEVARLRTALDGAGEPRPALEYILSWLHDTAPPTTSIVLAHGDYRTGNYMVDDGRLSGILDWEFAHWGDPLEDIGWLTARCWRFGNDAKTVGGIAGLDAFLRAYNEASGAKVTAADLSYWQIMAAAKWATISVLQGDRYRRGGENRLELALTGLMAPEMEFDALSEIAAFRSRMKS